MMFNTLQIYDELSQTMDQRSARKLVNVMSSMYEELRNSVTKEEFAELKGTVQELAEAQKRTEVRLSALTERVEELAEAQKRTEVRLSALTERVEELAEAQKRTEQSLVQLAKRMELLSKRVDQTNQQVGGLNMTVGYMLENEAFRSLPELLRRDWQIEITESLRRDWLPTIKGDMVEVNIVGRGRRNGEAILLIGESKLQLSRKYVDKFLEQRLQKIEMGGLPVFPILIAHMESEPGVVKYAKEQGVAVYLSYQFQPRT
ncbi:MAG: hypothetical protein RBT80_20105 [Candidatus Vecturithrix sp.]|jgi:chromosome segregation ATPase|nr:hypothetical protein [Candidatus Vecturithrix sp.]